MHNSLYIRDTLRRTNSDPMRLERRDPHRVVAPDPASVCSPGDIALDGAWSVRHDGQTGANEAAVDLVDFLTHMGVPPGGAPGDGDNAIVLAVSADLPPRGFRLTPSETEIRIEASDAAGMWAGIAWMEREMRVRRGPFLSAAPIERNASWGTQISQGPWGGNYSVPDFSPEYLSDDAFRMYAHYGINSTMIYGDMMCYTRSSIFPELDCDDYDRNTAMLKGAAERAERYGVRLSYVVVGPKLRSDHPVFINHPGARGTGIRSLDGDYTIHCLCSSDGESLAFHGETFENLFTEVPQLAGLILIIAGESYYHCHMWGGRAIRCERCGPQDAEDVVAALVGATADAVKRVSPDAFVLAWPYNSSSWDRPDCTELIERLPSNSGYIEQIDREHLYEKDGYSKLIWDYSVDYIGPSDSIVRRAPLVKRRSLPFFLRTETGIGLEVFQFPYVPSMKRLADKWQVVRDLEPDGVHQAWLFFGMFGSRAEELGLWAAYAHDVARDDFLRAMAVRDFGPEAADAAMEAWSSMSEAVGHIPCVTLCTYYIGPSFLGPCHPLVPEKGAEVPVVFNAVLYYLQEGDETFSRARNEIATSLVMDTLPESARAVAIEFEGEGEGWDIVAREYRAAERLSGEAWQALEGARDLTRTNADAICMGEEALLAELVHRTFASCANTVEFLMARNAHERGDREGMRRMRAIAEVEKANAVGARHIYEKAPWLDLAERTDGVYSRCTDMIDEKVAWLGRFLSS